MNLITQLQFNSISKDSSINSKAKLELIEMGGRIAQVLGLPRSTGQIYGLLYFSSKPLSLKETGSILGLSKASTSTGTRQLASWGAIRKVWVPGERKDYYEVIEDFGQLIRGSYRTIIKPRIGSSINRLNQIENSLNNDFKTGNISKQQHQFMIERMNKIKKLFGNGSKLIPILERILEI